MSTELNRYAKILEKIFFDKYKSSIDEIRFSRDELISAAKSLKIELPKNLGDVLYSVRFRTPMPASILKKQPPKKEWIIEFLGKGLYAFKLVKFSRIVPNANLLPVKIPDSTPEIIAAYALSDEQALLAKVRYNRLIDIFLGITTYSLQSHLRTTVKGVGQIEIDEIYVGINEHGRQFVIPVQAKGGSDQLSAVQTKQDILCCLEKFPNLVCRAISTQFISKDLIAIFLLTLYKDEIKIIKEKHYELVPASSISITDLSNYSELNSV